MLGGNASSVLSVSGKSPEETGGKSCPHSSLPTSPLSDVCEGTRAQGYIGLGGYMGISLLPRGNRDKLLHQTLICIPAKDDLIPLVAAKTSGPANCKTEIVLFSIGDHPGHVNIY